MAKAPTLATIGYESRTLPEMIQRLKAAKVAVVVDLRAVAASRRPGFAKSILAATLAAHGIDYVHLRELGTPKAGRLAARAGRVKEMHAIFNAHLRTPEAQAGLARAGAIARERRAVLLCLEADAAHCHRAIVAGRLRETIGCTIENL